MNKNDVAIRELEDAIDTIDLKIDEYSKLIFGYEETSDNDMIFEEYVEFLQSLKFRLESSLEFLKSE